MPRRKQTEGEKKIDISQMAEDLGVSKTTVSRALSGNGRVSEATRARVVQYAKEKNYVPNMLARGLVTQQSYNISLVFSRQFGNLAAPFLRKTVSAVYDIATRNDYDVLMKGLRRIALLGGSMLYTVNQSRLEGYKQAHDRACCKIDESLLFLELESDDLRTSAVELAVQRGADCILCMDDQVAQLALSTLRQLNLRVPQDIRLASLYDDEALQGCTPQITAVSFDAEQLGRRTAQQLLSLIRHQPVETRTLLGYQVGLRLSTQT